ncbi:MAG: helix-turn-helix domain-containing protein [Euryarchaeota archaeon]|nr:helix-turn-helix domain-containing protein [Euryarchaeota archaeon]
MEDRIFHLYNWWGDILKQYENILKGNRKKMKTVNKSYKYRIYPNKEQQRILEFNNR